MKINLSNTPIARKQRGDLARYLLEQGCPLSHAARFAEEFGDMLIRSEVVEIHVFTSVIDLEKVVIHTNELRLKLRQDKAKVVAKIARDGFCVAFATKSRFLES